MRRYRSTTLSAPLLCPCTDCRALESVKPNKCYHPRKSRAMNQQRQYINSKQKRQQRQQMRGNRLYLCSTDPPSYSLVAQGLNTPLTSTGLLLVLFYYCIHNAQLKKTPCPPLPPYRLTPRTAVGHLLLFCRGTTTNYALQ